MATKILCKSISEPTEKGVGWLIKKIGENREVHIPLEVTHHLLMYLTEKNFEE